MKFNKLGIAMVIGGLLSLAALAENEGLVSELNNNQRLEQGMKSGESTTRDVSKLERDTTNAAKADAHTFKGRDLHREKNDGRTADSSALLPQRLEQDIQRSTKQERIIEQGFQPGELTGRTPAKPELWQSQMIKDGHASVRQKLYE